MRRERLESEARALAALKHFSGSVLVAEGNSTLLDASFGLADSVSGEANTTSTKFRIGSITKQFTAVLIELLREEGTLRLTDPVSKYIQGSPVAWAGVTIHQALNHTSGIADFTDDPRFEQWSSTTRTPAETIAFFRERPLEFPSGSKFQYSNSNYILLGGVVETASGRRFGDLLREKLLIPLRMIDSGLDEGDQLDLTRRAKGHVLTNGALRPSLSPVSAAWAAGGMYSTTGDLLRWVQGLFGLRVVSDESLRQMTGAGRIDYAYGFALSVFQGELLVWHDGSIDGFSAYLSYLPARGITVIILSNVENDEVVDSMHSGLLAVARE
ncbi:serine hydrolase domain-containing protein [Bryobacter aggregatus]|uniref:serine hydrolase domain-containing protein n=1 Tax=Bryobacter aggregatus TaxID=360054 RepID=UPI00068CA854|nr:serine hydrolase domain-containing protein [Bryobacter aggregatus]